MKHQLQRHEKRVHNTQILADGTVIKKRRQKREIGPDGKPRLTWIGGEIIGFAGPPNGGGTGSSSSATANASISSSASIEASSVGQNSADGEGDEDRNNEVVGNERIEEGISCQTVNDAISTGATNMTPTNEQNLNIISDVRSEMNNLRSEAEHAVMNKIESEKTSATAPVEEIPMLPVVEGEERSKVEALLLKLSNVKQIQVSH